MISRSIRSVFRILTVGVLLLAGAACQQPAPDFDVIVRGGTIYDGSGDTPYRGDVAIEGERIVAVAGAGGPAGRESRSGRRRRRG